MHFVKTIISLFALSSFAAAQYADEAGLNPRDNYLAAREEFLDARDTYLAARDLYVRGPRIGKCEKSPGGGLPCVFRGHMCKSCEKGKKAGDNAANRWAPFLVASAALSAIGSSIIYTFGPDTPMDKWLGHQILAGSPTGYLSQIPNMSNASAVDMTDMRTISAMTLFFQLIGGSFSVSAGSRSLAT
ncbi:unnamed protein product [Clonostachys rosea f. rosea IK726]|uniref:Uncharacterized protein n=1 Tax=Clonostachys rosea f. rosea IK726 TaxID=1349383 RepID=A0ACA9TLG2_BIOOC|nr:unnamed protein product [Clonostachys rosea f. rosea IK726]